MFAYVKFKENYEPFVKDQEVYALVYGTKAQVYDSDSEYFFQIDTDILKVIESYNPEAMKKNIQDLTAHCDSKQNAINHHSTELEKAHGMISLLNQKIEILEKLSQQKSHMNLNDLLGQKVKSIEFV